MAPGIYEVHGSVLGVPFFFPPERDPEFFKVPPISLTGNSFNPLKTSLT